MKQWDDPAKRKPKAETLNTQGNFGEFTEVMRKLLKAKPEGKPKPASRAPAAS